MLEVVGRQGAVACPSKCQRNWLKGKAYLTFPGKINKQRRRKKRSQGNAMGPNLLRLLSGSCFHLGGMLAHQDCP